MSSPLKVKRLDSPLARNTGSTLEERSQRKPATATSATPKPRRVPPADSRRLASVGPEPPEASPSGSSLDSLAEPPALGEPLELISSRLPVSLRRSLTELTIALRAREGGRVSQKGLPEQEVLAVLIWAAGSAEDPEAIARLAQTLSGFRARRYAAAAAALQS